ncbi:peptide chain release factor N(5)-glutamine methyltransferase [Mycolicibacterium diernhoferi]|uniref:Release factor glutamine methyltransferase n=1 Tax=Mycolicibacterium diernhoferi TaxID=1801 RepID=A0A1Q4H8G1_9MYCO|nr:peptide chain release factor N(5)-glutamine methyltransferase [Mycolicibacterium diernhoferi]OJZ63755.1 protein-(glutamine-N5) methyltransferase, release factor-specific [Mycolicibacterium diernhoferi]OPE55723.1 protein-(glutamine-N5) methyltransferase, release factor-specific [Mycolicibacterium diernhoferi]PEG54246.1 protein-(glutamine-N5) methyltransferase, release factor-specific [Mycolicibacterium diernhoferi]QYL21500.1 peptide chain release factor N(5)-glutamine methyltransferase [Mycol
MTDVGQAIADAAAALAAAGIDSARADAELLAAHVAGVDRGLLRFTEPAPDFLDRYRTLVGQRALRIPLQHLVGSAAFGPLTLAVGPGVFIPRPETEALLEWAHAVPVPVDGLIVDLCTGSGALALALATYRPDVRVIAVEQSGDALRYARANVAGSQVQLIQADVTAPDVLGDLAGSVDLVVSNPPYIPEGADLEPEVADHDPHAALFGGPDGMAVIAPIVDLVARLLRPGGQVGVEHDDTTSAATVDLFGAAGVFTDITARRDLAGRHRFVTAVRS